jgi:hypothetical protein
MCSPRWRRTLDEGRGGASAAAGGPLGRRQRGTCSSSCRATGLCEFWKVSRSLTSQRAVFLMAARWCFCRVFMFWGRRPLVLLRLCAQVLQLLATRRSCSVVHLPMFCRCCVMYSADVCARKFLPYAAQNCSSFLAGIWQGPLYGCLCAVVQLRTTAQHAHRIIASHGRDAGGNLVAASKVLTWWRFQGSPAPCSYRSGPGMWVVLPCSSCSGQNATRNGSGMHGCGGRAGGLLQEHVSHVLPGHICYSNDHNDDTCMVADTVALMQVQCCAPPTEKMPQ